MKNKTVSLKVSSFVASPIQMKAASSRAFSIDRKYSKIAILILAYVWTASSRALCAIRLA